MSQTSITTVLDKAGKERLAEWSRRRRGDRSQNYFAKLIGIAQGTVSNYENGNGSPGIEQIKLLAKYEGVTPEDFLAFLYGRAINSQSLREFLDLLTPEELIQLQEEIASALKRKIALFNHSQ